MPFAWVAPCSHGAPCPDNGCRVNRRAPSPILYVKAKLLGAARRTAAGGPFGRTERARASAKQALYSYQRTTTAPNIHYRMQTVQSVLMAGQKRKGYGAPRNRGEWWGTGRRTVEALLTFRFPSAFRLAAHRSTRVAPTRALLMIYRLERLTKPSLDEVPADQRAAQHEERQMDVGAAFVANAQPPLAVEPRDGALHHPAMSSQPLAGVDPRAGNPRNNSPRPQRPTFRRAGVAFVSVQLVRSTPGPTARSADRRNRIHDGFDHRHFIDVGRRQHHRQRDAVGIDHKMALRARFAAIRRIRPGRFAPPGAATLDASMAARDQSI